MVRQQVVEKLRLLIADELDFFQPGIDDLSFVPFQICSAEGMRSQSM